MKINGFTLVELIIAIGLAAVFIPAIVFVYSFSLGSASGGESYTRAYALAQEQMEAVYYLKSGVIGWNWLDDSINTNPGEYYQPNNLSGNWVLGAKTSAPASIDGYISTVEIYEVLRDGGGSIVDGAGVKDEYTRKIKVRVSWKENGIPTGIDLISYVTNH